MISACVFFLKQKTSYEMRISDWSADVGSSDLADARRWLAGADDWDALGGEIAHGLSVAELRWMAMREWARTTDDILWRRSKLGLLFTAAETELLARHIERVTAEARQADAEFFGDASDRP